MMKTFLAALLLLGLCTSAQAKVYPGETSVEAKIQDLTFKAIDPAQKVENFCGKAEELWELAIKEGIYNKPSLAMFRNLAVERGCHLPAAGDA